jgi:hypothetical protein
LRLLIKDIVFTMQNLGKLFPIKTWFTGSNFAIEYPWNIDTWGVDGRRTLRGRNRSFKWRITMGNILTISLAMHNNLLRQLTNRSHYARRHTAFASVQFNPLYFVRETRASRFKLPDGS